MTAKNSFALPWVERKIYLKELTKFSEVVESVDFVKYETGKSGSRPAGFRHARVTGAVDFNYFSVKLTPKVEQFIRSQMYMGDTPHEVYIEFLFYEEGHVLMLARNNTILAERYLTMLQAADVPTGNKPQVIGDKVKAAGGGKSKIPDSILKILSDMEQDGDTLKKYAKQLDPADYAELDKVLAALGGKWKGGKTQAHVFDCTADELTEKLEAVLSTGEVTDAKKAFEFFETPKELADKMVQLSGLTQADSLLEPSAGRGALLEAAQRKLGNAKLIHYTAIEPLRQNVRFMEDKGFYTSGEDFDAFKSEREYDVVLMNPPFQKACEHVTRALWFLKKGGKLVAVMPSSILFREDKKYATLRKLIEAKGKIEKLPEDSFSKSGTNVSTVLVTMTK